MKTWTLATLALTVFLSGCKAVYIHGPLGDKAVELKADEWEGAWNILGENDVVEMRVADPKAGKLEIAGVNAKEKGFELETYPVLIREYKNWQFVNIQSKDKPGFYTWGRIKNDDNKIILWGPDPEKFSALVKKGTLPGKIDGDNIFLEKLTPAQMDLITTDTQGTLMAWDEPLILVRSGK